MIAPLFVEVWDLSPFNPAPEYRGISDVYVTLVIPVPCWTDEAGEIPETEVWETLCLN